MIQTTALPPPPALHRTRELDLHSLFSLQLEDGHSLFDYDVKHNELIQILIRQKVVASPVKTPKNEEKEEKESDNKENQEVATEGAFLLMVA